MPKKQKPTLKLVKPPADRSKVGRMSRRKGKRFEQIVAAQLREIFGDQVKRGWQAREGHDASDVEGVPGWWVECKNHQRVNIREAYEQAEAAKALSQDADAATVVFAKDMGKPALAIVDMSVFMVLLANEHVLKKEVAELEKRLGTGGAQEADTPQTAGAKAKMAAGMATAFIEVFRPAQPGE